MPKSFHKGAQAFLSDSKRDPQYLNPHMSKNPGPGQYQPVVNDKKPLRAKSTSFGCTTKRPFQQPDQLTEVGPGKYTVDESLQERTNRLGQITEASSNFKSNTKRVPFNNAHTEVAVGQYEINQNDLSKRVEKQRSLIENLKKIDVKRAPFESSIARFTHYNPRGSTKKVVMEEAQMQEIKQLQ